MSPTLIAFVSIIISSLFGSSTGVVTKVLFSSFPIFLLAFWRFVVASLFILPFFLYKERNLKWRQYLKDLLPIALLGNLNIILFYLGIKLTTASSSQIVYTSTPLLVAFIGYFFLKEKLNKVKIIGLTLGFLGILTIVLVPLIEHFQFNVGSIQGNILIFCAAIVYAFYTVGSGHFIKNKNYSPLALTTLFTLSGTIVFLFLHLLTESISLVPLKLLTLTNFLLVLYLGIFATVITYLLYQWGIKHSSAVTASLSLYIQPVFAILLAIGVLGEVITPWFILGTALVMLGVFFVTGKGLVREVRKIKGMPVD